MSSLASTAPSGWIRRGWWDASILAFGWLPFYAWLATTAVGRNELGQPYLDTFAIALGVTLALNFLHRHYVFLMVYGDGRALAERRRAYFLVPPLILGVVGSAYVFGAGRATVVVLGILGVWNVWHVVQQRYGILRIYGGRAGGGLELREHARRDMALLWSAIAFVATALLMLRRGTFVGHREARKALEILTPITDTFAGWLFFAVAAIWFLSCAIAWARAELAATPKTSRAPRLLFLGSTFALLGVFLVNGPVVGYLCFGVAHSIEYVGFVHHFGEKKYGGADARPGLASFFLKSVARSPLVIAPLLGAFWLLHEHRLAIGYLVYYSSTAAIHFLFDGWIWKVRKPEVARPLGVGEGGSGELPVRSGAP